MNYFVVVCVPVMGFVEDVVVTLASRRWRRRERREGFSVVVVVRTMVAVAWNCFGILISLLVVRCDEK